MSADTQAPPLPPAPRRLRVVVALLAILVLAVAFSACGGSSGSNSGTTSGAGATNSASTTKQGGARSGRFASLRSCLQKAGINLPTAPSRGAGRPGGGGPPSGGPRGFKLPGGVSRSKFQEAIQNCGGRGFPGGARRGFNGSTARAALSKYATCMRQNGVNLPAPNTGGKGPVFDTKGIDTSSEKFKTAQKKCQSDLKGAFGAGRPRAGGPPPAGAEGGPPAGAGTPPAGGYGPPPAGSAVEGG